MKNGFERNCGFFLAGALVGGAAMMLTTPISGRRMRRIVKNKFEEASDQISHAAETLKTGAEEIYTRGEKMARGAGILG